MGFPYEDLDDTQFERLVVQVCRKLFGAGVQSFAAGRDGGRDARFEGTAELFPSKSAPWAGVTVIQAKHTNATNAHYGDSSFSGNIKTAVLSEEIPKIQKMVVDGEVDNYILFANRRLGGVASPVITKRIAVATDLDRSKIYLAGTEYLDDMIHEYPEILTLAKIDPIDSPLLVSSYEIAEVILAIADVLDSPVPDFDAEVVDRVSYQEKNVLNRMTPEFAALLSDRYLKYTHQIEKFLADPANSDTLRRYEGAVDEFQFKIVARRANYQTFDDVFNYLVDILVRRDSILSRTSNKPLLRAMLFYMYWHCDIGESVNAKTT